MYGSIRRRLWDEKNKMADNVQVAMESSDDQFVLRLYKRLETTFMIFYYLRFYVSHILQPIHVAFALIFRTNKTSKLALTFIPASMTS